METLLDLSEITIEKVMAQLKVVNNRRPSSIKLTAASGKLLLTQEQWHAR